ncbi:MAG: sugar dehydrogenase [Verrucomicrobia bacterium]|nr:MAG: sugar dehydrogenase [Verrucomicrobiota bacterium]
MNTCDREFQNKVVIITGGGTGIGKAAAQAFLNKGANLLINGRRESILSQTAQELDPSGKRVAYVSGDASLKSTAQKIAAVAEERFGGSDILINNAGIFRPTPFLEHTETDVDAYIGVAIKGPFFAAQAVIPSMIRRGGGSIVNVGSMWALIAVNATPSSAYSAGKAGLHALTRNLALEFAANKIRVNAIAPAVVETPVYDTFLTAEQRAATLPTFEAFHPLGRNGQPADVVEAILFLAGQRADWITGVILPVDGGVTSGIHRV